MDWLEPFNQRLIELEKAGNRRSLFVTPAASLVHNDYLGLSDHPLIREAGSRALEFEGGSRGSRLLGGNRELVEVVEGRIAEFFGAPAALLFSSGYLANLGVLSVLGKEADQIVSHRRNHASLIDGIRLCSTPRTLVDDWEGPPASTRERLLLVSESLFSMDGDGPTEAGLKRWLDGTESFLVLDEAHSAGLFGEHGEAMAGGWGDWDRVAQIVPFGKAFGVGGAAVVGSQTLIDSLINLSRSFIYSTAPPPALAAMIGASLEVVRVSGEFRAELHRRSQWFRKALGLEPPTGAWGDRSPIVPLQVAGGPRAVVAFSEALRERGVESRPIRYPTVPVGEERIRFSLNLRVDQEELEGVVRACLDLKEEFLSRA